MMNPIAAILEQFRHAVIDQGAPSAVEAAGGWAWMVIPIVIFIGVIAFGVWYFDREAPRIAEEL
jgi:ABC-2 type transport system permease protein